MKHLSIAIVFILAFSFCKKKGINNAEFKSELIKNDNVFRLSEHYAKFRFHDLTEFEVYSWDYEEMKKRYKNLDSLEINQIIQGDKDLLEINQIIQGDTDLLVSRFYCYSTFADSSLIALIGDSSDENGHIIWLLKYNKKGKLQSKIAIAGRWGDAGDAWHGHSKMIKTNTFICTDVSSSMIGNDIENGDEQLDSTIVSIKFDKNNKPKIDTLFKNQEIIKNKKE
jgi:hypothetical protein